MWTERQVGHSHADLDGGSSLCHTGTISTAGAPEDKKGLLLTMVLFWSWGLYLACLRQPWLLAEQNFWCPLEGISPTPVLENVRIIYMDSGQVSWCTRKAKAGGSLSLRLG